MRERLQQDEQSLEVLADPRLDQHGELQAQALDVLETQEHLFDLVVGQAVASRGGVEDRAGVRLETQFELAHLGGFVEQRVLVRRGYQQVVFAGERDGFLEEAGLELEPHLERLGFWLAGQPLGPGLCGLGRLLAAGLFAGGLLRASAGLGVELVSLLYFYLEPPSSVVLPNKICWVTLTACVSFLSLAS